MPVSLDELTRSIEQLPPLPGVVMQVIRAADDPDESNSTIARLVASDVGLAARVLQIANSAYYGLPRRVVTVHDAVMLLGIRCIRNAALAAGAYQTLRQPCEAYGFAPGGLWRHSLEAAVAAQVVASRSRAARPDEAFVCGLLHDVGKVPMGPYIRAELDAIRQASLDGGIAPHAAERSVLGMDHAEAGARIAAFWNLPEAVCCAIEGHHEVERCRISPRLAAITCVASSLNHNDLFGRPAAPLAPAVLGLLGIEATDVEPIARQVAEQSAKASAVAHFD